MGTGSERVTSIFEASVLAQGSGLGGIVQLPLGVLKMVYWRLARNIEALSKRHARMLSSCRLGKGVRKRRMAPEIGLWKKIRSQKAV